MVLDCGTPIFAGKIRMLLAETPCLLIIPAPFAR
jgi:hypothetical protein